MKPSFPLIYMLPSILTYVNSKSLIITVLRRFRTFHSERRTIVAAFGTTSYFLDVDHPVRYVLCAVLRRSYTFLSEERLLTTALNSAEFVPDVDHAIWCVLCTVLRLSRSGHSERRPLAAALTGLLCAAVHEFLAFNSKRMNFTPVFGSVLAAGGEVECPHLDVLLPVLSCNSKTLPHRDTSRNNTRAFNARFIRVCAASSTATICDYNSSNLSFTNFIIFPE